PVLFTPVNAVITLTWLHSCIQIEVIFKKTQHFSAKTPGNFSLGRSEKALDALERAVSLGVSDAGAIGRDPDLASIRKEPRFRALLQRLEGAQAPN
ncbi:MAG: hypothetical protein WBX15_08360, partial [Thermoanaerobaculia bacterium]